MKIIISPAKRIQEESIYLEPQDHCLFPQQTQKIIDELKKLNPSELQNLLGCSFSIAQKAWNDTQKLDLSEKGVPALLAFDGIQYQKMAPSVMSDEQLLYLQNHLYILSALYGSLRPLDGIQPYRLELENRLIIENQLLPAYWQETCASLLQGEEILDLTSRQYSKLIPKTKLIRCFFMEEEANQRREKGVYVKMARGAMVRFLAENKIEKIEEAKQFSEMGYVFDEIASDSAHYVFVRKSMKRE